MSPPRHRQVPYFLNRTGGHAHAHVTCPRQVPYFLVAPADMPLDGTTPTLLYGYGGFEISLTPAYSGGVGAAWLEKGYAYVQASTRLYPPVPACNRL